MPNFKSAPGPGDVGPMPLGYFDEPEYVCMICGPLYRDEVKDDKCKICGEELHAEEKE